MFLEICMQIYSVVFAVSRQITKQKVCKNNQSPCEGNKIFGKYQAQGGGLTPPPCVRPWTTGSILLRDQFCVWILLE